MSSVNLDLEEYNALMEARRIAENEAAELRQQLNAARLTNGTEHDISLLNTTVRNVAEIARFAVANLPPETIKGWPWERLNALANQIEALPDTAADDTSFAAELRVFARECEKHERRRAAMPKQPVEEIDMRNGVA